MTDFFTTDSSISDFKLFILVFDLFLDSTSLKNFQSILYIQILLFVLFSLNLVMFYYRMILCLCILFLGLSRRPLYDSNFKFLITYRICHLTWSFFRLLNTSYIQFLYFSIFRVVIVLSFLSNQYWFFIYSDCSCCSPMFCYFIIDNIRLPFNPN